MARETDDRRAVERMCAATRAVRPVDELIRFVRAPDGQVVPDLKRRLPGRGVWVTAEASSVAEAVKRRAFSRGFGEAVRTEGLVEALGGALERQALEMLSLANKAGALVAGFGKVETAIHRGDARVVLHAADAAEDGVRKIGQAIRRAGAAPEILRLFSSEQMDLALGRSNVIHAALTVGPVSDAFLAKAQQLLRYRAGGGSEPVPAPGVSSEPGQPAETDME